jgi:hypothetical protein
LSVKICLLRFVKLIAHFILISFRSDKKAEALNALKIINFKIYSYRLIYLRLIVSEYKESKDFEVCRRFSGVIFLTATQSRNSQLEACFARNSDISSIVGVASPMAKRQSSNC